MRLNQKPHRLPDGSFRNQGADVGAPDLVVGLAGGVTLFVECKTGRKGPRPEQRAEAASWIALGHHWLVIHDILEFDAALDRLSA